MHEAQSAFGQPVCQVTDLLFAWGGGPVVLLGERCDARWILARAWPDGDRLTDVRRWHFDTRDRFVAQVFRLVREATRNEEEAQCARDEALAWTARCAFALPEPAFDEDYAAD